LAEDLINGGHLQSFARNASRNVLNEQSEKQFIEEEKV
jgi:hypothetical protein